MSPACGSRPRHAVPFYTFSDQYLTCCLSLFVSPSFASVCFTSLVCILVCPLFVCPLLFHPCLPVFALPTSICTLCLTRSFALFVPGGSFPEESVCPFCSQWRQPDNHHVRVRPKRKASRRVQQLLRREASRRHLNLEQTRVLRKFHGSQSMLMATCHTCHRKSKKGGALRNFLASLSKSQSTPEGTGKNSSASSTPRILSKSASELFKSSSRSTPFRTPRSASTESGISPKQGSATSSFSRLRKLLIKGDTQTSKNGTLKDFLSSL
ncbi:UPF0711 protein C18orf21 homolog isoform X1 [Paramormyrops kingsleyae]|uniref:UPF0711 protein C18orf21 homolog isoform X1 n=1 Tax=Paramormyrops kingsleyae TaxID=1676925 RepID=UPI003B96C3B8